MNIFQYMSLNSYGRASVKLVMGRARRREHEEFFSKKISVFGKPAPRKTFRNSRFKTVNLLKGKLPSLPFEDMKNAVLGKSYILELAFISRGKMQTLNKKFRKQNKTTDILSFPLSRDEGQIVICLSAARRQAKKFRRSFKNFIAFLFIHGLAHLKGMEHGSRMEALERKVRAIFKI